MYLSENVDALDGLGRFKLSDKWRKGLLTIAPIALSFIPVVGWIGAAAMLASKGLQARKMIVAQKEERKQQEDMMIEQQKQQLEYQRALSQQSRGGYSAGRGTSKPTYIRSPDGKIIRIDPPSQGFSLGNVSPLMVGAAGAGVLALILLTGKK